jgi:hypothetical protein
MGPRNRAARGPDQYVLVFENWAAVGATIDHPGQIWPSVRAACAARTGHDNTRRAAAKPHGLPPAHRGAAWRLVAGAVRAGVRME